MIERCYKCGRIKCETCDGTGEHVWEAGGHEMLCCPDCSDGWRDDETPMTCPHCGSTDICFSREVDEEHYGYYYCGSCGEQEVDGNMKSKTIKGEDPDILCPDCKEDV